MQKKRSIKLLFPQWQGGYHENITALRPELGPTANFGYNLGSHLLNFLGPKLDCPTIEVPVSTDMNDVKLEKGIYARSALLEQHKKAVKLLKESDPTHIIVYGGECSVSVAPFKYLINKYGDDVCVVWIDAHPDIGLPGEYPGYHAMALAMILGHGDEEFLNEMPAKIPTSKALTVGVRSWESDDIKKRINDWKLLNCPPEEVRNNIKCVNEWIKSTGCKKVCVHFDLDVIDPEEMYAAVGKDPNGLKIKEVLDIINGIAKEYEIIGLTVAEHMPSIEIRLQQMLNGLPRL